jgi:hypothetical protein
MTMTRMSHHLVWFGSSPPVDGGPFANDRTKHRGIDSHRTHRPLDTRAAGPARVEASLHFLSK